MTLDLLYTRGIYYGTTGTTGTTLYYYYYFNYQYDKYI